MQMQLHRSTGNTACAIVPALEHLFSKIAAGLLYRYRIYGRASGDGIVQIRPAQTTYWPETLELNARSSEILSMLPLVDPPSFDGIDNAIVSSMHATPYRSTHASSNIVGLWRFCSSDLWIYGCNRLASGVSDLSTQY